MTFDEFFKKKRIDLPAFEKSEPELFNEFERHYEQMGEKSFDHTKKYWFNNLRGKYLLPVEIKTEKPKIENPLAEQTITGSLMEEGDKPAAGPKLGFVPKFRAAAPPKVVEEKTDSIDQPEKPTENKPAQPYKPRFNMKSIPQKPPQE